MDKNGKQSGAPVLHLEACDLSSLYCDSKIWKAINSGETAFPIHRSTSFAARMGTQELMDLIALNDGWEVQRPDSHSVMLQAGETLAIGQGHHSGGYCSCHFSFCGNQVAEVEALRDRILELVGDRRITEPMYSIGWYFQTAEGELKSASIRELADDVLFDEAYPNLDEGVDQFVNAFIASDESVLVLQGPPGTGKTRLIRYIFGALSRQAGGARVMYTTDNKALSNDEIFVQFITGYDSAFVVEDADHLLSPRSDGNENLHRFLSIADGVIRAQRRKIIFSTNLPEIGDLDEALIRPGRCFRHLMFRNLTSCEAVQLLARLCGDETDARARIENSGESEFSLARIYQLA